MPIFNPKFLLTQDQDEEKLKKRYINLQIYQAKASDIKGFKEEKFQTQFLKDIFEDYPALKDRMEEISPKFKMLKTPLARIMLPKATIKIASERTGVELNTLIAEIKKRLGK